MVLDKLFGRKRPTEEEPPDEARRIAFAALMVEAARADDHYDDRERRLITGAVSRLFSLDETEALALRERAERAQADAHDLHRFTKIAKDQSREDKIAFAEILWTIILSDGERDPYEDALMRRLCGLLYLDDQDSGAARRSAERAIAAETRAGDA